MKKIIISILIICAILASVTGNIEGQVNGNQSVVAGGKSNQSPSNNNPPTAPIITGPTSIVVGEEYEYTFNATDPDENDVKYYIKWGDGSDTGWIGPYASGEEVTLSHTWYLPLTYTIKAQARDCYWVPSPWGYLVVTVTWPDDVEVQHSQSSQQSS